MLRTLFLILWIALLLVPASGLLGAPERQSMREARVLAQRPEWPTTVSEWLALPKNVDAFVRDQFGFRTELIRANAVVREALNDEASGNGNFLVGSDGFLLLREGLSESLGFGLAPERAQESAELVCEMQRRLSARGVSFVYAIAPAPTTIYPEAAPRGMGPPIAPTNYDLLIDAARACGAHTLDLRTLMRPQRTRHLLYRRTDTHWTPRGALIAYNGIVHQLGHSELSIDADAISWRSVPELGDLTRIVGPSDMTEEFVDRPDLGSLPSAAPAITPLPEADPTQAGFIHEYPREGLSVLLIGDSFTHAFFPDYLAPFARRVTFIHHQRCGFDWRKIEQAEPDLVLLMPTERFALCAAEARPANLN